MIQPLRVSDEVIQRILELSADLQIKRRATTKYSLEFHDYSVAIAAFGRVLEALTNGQPQQEKFATVALLGSLRTLPESRPAF